MRCWPGRRGLRVLITPLPPAAGLSALAPAAASAASARGSSMAIRRLVLAGLLAALAAAGIAVMPGSGAGSVTPHAHIVSQGVPIASGPVLGPTG
jgi:hypothetical protein